MAVQLGSGEYTFEVNENWAKLPEEITLGDCAAVGVDRQNRVYAFNRGEHPVAVFDAEGNLLRTWGEGVFHRPHGVHMGPDDTIWLTDDGDHTVRKCTLDGKVLMTLGIPGEPKPFMSGEPFHRCTHTALSPQGDLYVSDGYGNARFHKQPHGIAEKPINSFTYADVFRFYTKVCRERMLQFMIFWIAILPDFSRMLLHDLND